MPNVIYECLIFDEQMHTDSTYCKIKLNKFPKDVDMEMKVTRAGESLHQQPASRKQQLLEMAMELNVSALKLVVTIIATKPTDESLHPDETVGRQSW